MAHSSFLTQHNGKLVLVLILSKDSLNRIENHDPLIHEGAVIANQIRVRYPELPKVTADTFPISSIDVMICHEEEAEALAKARELCSGDALMKWLARNWSNDERPATKDGFTYSEVIKPREPKP